MFGFPVARAASVTEYNEVVMLQRTDFEDTLSMFTVLRDTLALLVLFSLSWKPSCVFHEPFCVFH